MKMKINVYVNTVGTKPYSAASFDMSTMWGPAVAEVEIEFAEPSHETVTLAKIDALTKQKNDLLADAHVRAERIQGLIDNLLAIELKVD